MSTHDDARSTHDDVMSTHPDVRSTPSSPAMDPRTTPATAPAITPKPDEEIGIKPAMPAVVEAVKKA